MVYSDDVCKPEVSLYPLDPPGISIFLHLIPSVERISPKLACGREGIRWNTCRCFLDTVFIKLQKIGVGPSVYAVGSHEDRDIPHNLHTFFICIFLELIPLGIEEILEDTIYVHKTLLLFSGLVHSLLLSYPEILRPYAEPSGIIIFCTKGLEESIVFKPPTLFFPKCSKVFQVFFLTLGQEVCSSLEEHRHLQFPCLSIVDSFVFIRLYQDVVYIQPSLQIKGLW